MAKCPIHNEELSTYRTTLTKMEKSFTCVSGRCPRCTREYLNMAFFHHYNEVEIQGKKYIYYKQLEEEFPGDNHIEVIPTKKQPQEGLNSELPSSEAQQNQESNAGKAIQSDIAMMHNVFLPGDITDFVCNIEQPTDKVSKGNNQLRTWNPYKLVILKQIKPSKYLVAVCRKKQKKTQACVMTNRGRLFLRLATFFHVDVNELSPCPEYQLKGNKEDIAHRILKLQKEFAHSNNKQFFVDLDNCQQSDITIISSSKDTRKTVDLEKIGNTEKKKKIYKTIVFVSKYPSCCKFDGNSLGKVKNASFQINDVTLTHSGRYCDSCDTIYLPKSQKINIQKLLSQKTAIEKHVVDQEPFRWDVPLLQIPALESGSMRCPFCKKEFSGMSNIRYQLGDESVRYTSARTCSSCKLAILDSIQLQQIQNQLKNIRIPILRPSEYKSASELMTATKRPPNATKSENTVKVLPYEHEAKRPINLSEHGKKIVIFAQKCHCAMCFKKYDRHTIIPRTAKVLSVSGSMVDVTVMFCAGCGQYYMGYESFKQYKKEYGRLLFECELSDELQHKYSIFGDFSPDSVLSRWGYSVKKDMPKTHRQAILSFLLETGRIHKFEAIEMIKGFISLRENQPKFYDACDRWREDILFINNYRIKGQDVVYGLTFKQGGKISR